ncbi:MAG: general secretion pathway protein GspK [Gammaproteobacteria bacterium]|nr:general secretion pathway protein GspK [Gammaproteobacteria bacterium]
MPGGSAGLALVVALWFIAILSLLALGFSQATRTDNLVTRNLVERIKARHLAEAAAMRGIHGLLTVEGRFYDAMINGRPVELPWEGAQLRVRLQDENGKVDINKADETLLEDLLTSIGLESDQALRLAHAIADWRDENDLRRPEGAERSEYQSAGWPWPPADRPFLSVDELRQVLGVTPEIFAGLAPLVTVYSGSAEINPNFSPVKVLESLRGTDAAELERFIADRKIVGDAENPAPILALINVESLVSGQVGPVYSVIGEAQLPSKTTATRRLVVWIPEERLDKPYYLLESGSAYPEVESDDAER